MTVTLRVNCTCGWDVFVCFFRCCCSVLLINPLVAHSWPIYPNGGRPRIATGPVDPDPVEGVARCRASSMAEILLHDLRKGSCGLVSSATVEKLSMGMFVTVRFSHLCYLQSKC
jgi:hypothetical protein